MDYLTWLTLLQEADSSEQLPEFSAETGRLGKAASEDGASASAVAAVELEAQWKSTALAAEVLQQRFVRQHTDSGRTQKEAGKTAFYTEFWQDRPYAEVFREDDGGADMEAISRFFERDARRF